MKRNRSLAGTLQRLIERGCFPGIAYRGKGRWRAHINVYGNRWAEGSTPYQALRLAVIAWERDGCPKEERPVSP